MLPLSNALLSRIASLAASVLPFRAGTTAPAAAPPLAGAPERSNAHVAGGGLLRRSLRACTAEGLLAEIVAACAGGAVLTGWALYLGAGAFLTGLVVALPQMAQLCQLPAAWTTSRLGHRRACLWLIGASRQVTLPLCALPFLPVADGGRQVILMGVAALAAVLGVLGNNAWVAWMGELVPSRIRGRYFGRRTGLCMLGGALASAGAGVLLDWARPRGLTGVALAALQLFACAIGALTVVLMRRQHDPAPGVDPAPISLARALAPFRDATVRPVVRYQIAWNAAVGLAGSFFALHMLRNLKMGFTLVAVHGTALAAIRMISAPLWGRVIDRVGARPVLLACSFGIAAVPLVWLIPTPTCLWPLAIDAVLAGALWSGHALASFALPLSITPRVGRPFYVAAFATASGVAFCAATAVGGLFAQTVTGEVLLFGRAYGGFHALFVASAVMRLGAAFLGLAIREPRARAVVHVWGAFGAALVRAVPRGVRALGR